MNDDQKDVAIIQASGLLLTLIFLILPIRSSDYTLVTTLDMRYMYAVGFFFLVAASAATMHLFLEGNALGLEGLQNMEFIFFMMGLIGLAIPFFVSARRDVYTSAWIVFFTLVMIAVSLLIAYRHRPASV